MASIVGGRAIRETRDRALRDGKNLVYGIGKVDPERALRIHHWVYDNWLGEVGRTEVTPEKMRRFLDALSKEPNESRWRFAVQSVAWQNHAGLHVKQQKAWKEEPLPSNDIAGLIKSFNHYRALNHFLPYLPGNGPDVEKRSIVLMLLNYGTLKPKKPNRDGTKSKESAGAYRHYEEALAPGEIFYARQKFKEIQQLMAQGATWLEYLKTLGLRQMDAIDRTHIEKYVPWRKKHPHPSRAKATWYGDVSDRMIRAELKYFSDLAAYGLAKNVLLKNPALNVSIPRHRVPKTGKPRANDPLTMKEVKDLIARLKEKLQEAKGTRTYPEVKLNVETILFLLLTGCRPKEAAQFSVTAEHVVFHRNDLSGGTGGKTEFASRRIRTTPVLKMVTAGGALHANKQTINLSERIHQFLKRANIDVTPYRIRHTVSTIRFKADGENAPQIAYELGHSNPTFTFQRYTKLDTYAECTVDEAKKFWHWLHHQSIKV